MAFSEILVRDGAEGSTNQIDPNSKPVVLPVFSVGGERATDLVFPSDLKKSHVPFMSFFATMGRPVFLPIPQGLTFSDSAAYSNIDLGIIGQIGTEALEQAANQKTISGAAGAFMGGLAGSVVNKARKLNAAAAASIISRNWLRQDGIANTIDFSQKQVIAPNTNTSFQNTGIRTFAFNFKLVAKSQKEADTIRAIVRHFRKFLYPEGDDVVMSYPPLWDIKFYNAESAENAHIPKIYPAYLTGFTSTHNASTNAFHPDGSPIDTDISLQFQESKALTRSDFGGSTEKGAINYL